MESRAHRQLRRGFEAYLDGEAGAEVAAVVRRHLTECWTCSEDAEWLMLVKAALHQLGTRRPTTLARARLARYASSLSVG